MVGKLESVLRLSKSTHWRKCLIADNCYFVEVHTVYMRLVVKLKSAHDKMITSVSLLALTVMAVVIDYGIV